jgi:hypothetical protein
LCSVPPSVRLSAINSSIGTVCKLWTRLSRSANIVQLLGIWLTSKRAKR